MSKSSRGHAPHTEVIKTGLQWLDGSVFPALCQVDDGMVVIIALDGAPLSATRNTISGSTSDTGTSSSSAPALRATPAIGMVRDVGRNLVLLGTYLADL